MSEQSNITTQQKRAAKRLALIGRRFQLNQDEVRVAAKLEQVEKAIAEIDSLFAAEKKAEAEKAAASTDVAETPMTEPS